MSRHPSESVSEYKERILNPISKSYCGAKWYFSTIWLGNGQTASCHHPPPHKISLDEIKNNPSALHNTRHKKLMRAQMLNGERPKECEYCWKIEDMSFEATSDRIHKTEFFSDEDNSQTKKIAWDADVPVRHLEIAFDRKCNLACSYCNAGYSSRWGDEIKKFGPYQNLISDGKGAFCHDGSWSDIFENSETNPYLEAFWKWWPDLKIQLEEFRITGGEPMMSPGFWKLLKLIKSEGLPERVLFTVNSNLSLPRKSIEKFVEETREIKRFGIYTSCESVGEQAQYIRFGLDYDLYCENIKFILRNSKIERFQFMVTVNALALFRLTEFLDFIVSLKDPVRKHLPAFGITILRFPSFMSASTLPQEIKNERANHLNHWLQLNKKFLLPHESESLERLIHYLKEVEDPHFKSSDLSQRRSDFKSFYNQYDIRRNVSLKNTFPKVLSDWLETVPEYNSPIKQKLMDGNASENYHDRKELELLETRFSSR